MSADAPFDASRYRLLWSSDSQKLTSQKLTAMVVVISALAWVAMVLRHKGGFSHQQGLNVQWLSGWLIMVVAMMMPPALPFLQAMQRLTHELTRGGAMVASAAAVFIATWTLAGLGLVTTGKLCASGLAAIPWLVDRPAVVSGFAALLVGAYQLSPLKQACLTACRSPVALMLVAWNEEHPWRSALAIGVRYAAVCIGCCWTLMLLTLVVGAFVLPLMVGVSVIMLLERLLPSVRPLVPLQAALACAIGILLLLGSLPPGLDIGGAGIFTHHTMGHSL
jgi:predicted metal-binding membrane protein